jgi:hypothetical protein
MASLELLLLYCVKGLSWKTCAVCLVSVPLSHAFGVWLHCPKRLRPWRHLLYPFSGGTSHVVLQLLSWVRGAAHVDARPTPPRCGHLIQ